MSVFTPLTFSQMQQLLAPYQLQLVEFSAASEGIENSNFFVTATTPAGDTKKLVLTILETLSTQEVTWFADLLQRLADQSLPVPPPLNPLQHFDGKPVTLAPCISGEHPDTPSIQQARACGRFLAQLHQCHITTAAPMPNERQRLQALGSHLFKLPSAWQAPAQQLLEQWQATADSAAYQLIHADLFRDNTLFVGDQLKGVLDFYHACYDLPIYDVAVALNDWALNPQGQPDPSLHAALLDGYQSIAALPQMQLLPLALAVAALRFWLSRLAPSLAATDASEGLGSKPPAEFAAKLTLRWQQLNDG